MLRSRTARASLAALATAGLLLGAACSSDSDESTGTTSAKGTTPGTAPGTTEGTTVPEVEATVEYDFTATATATEAEKAAETMTVRLENDGYPGSVAEVNADGTGLTITVVGAATEAEANAIVEPLTVTGEVWFRPVIEGPLPPAANETASAATPKVVGSGTTLPEDDAPTTPAADANPEGTDLLAQPDPRDDSVVARYQVGPAQVSGTAVIDATTTTQEGNPAVKVVLMEGADGLDAFNTMAQACYDKADSCPAGLYAVSFDGWVATAAAINPDKPFTEFTQSNLIIWSDIWTEDYAKLLAVVIEAGALPVGLTPA